jgi:outer membrane lipoprotein-sorting protein
MDRTTRLRSISLKRGAGALLGAALFTVFAGAACAIDVTTILARARQALEPGEDMRAKVVFSITNARGESVEWAGRLYRHGGSEARMRLVFESPLDLRGTDVTVSRTADGETRMRIYLPAIRRVRELTADMRGESFLGTDFNYEDLGFQQVDYQQHSLIDDDEIGGRPCYRIASVPDRGWWYGKILRYTDKKDYIPRRTEYSDRSGVLWKVRTFDGIKMIDTYPTWTRLTMQTIPTGTSTTITLSDIEYDTGLSPALFDGP